MANEHYFYLPEWKPPISEIILTGEEHRHLSRVLRMSPGQLIRITNGLGSGAEASIITVERQQTVCTVKSPLPEPDPGRRHITLAAALIRPSRWEWLLEKAVELGAAEILPLRTHYTGNITFKSERSRKIMLSALKQCGRFRLPVLHNPLTFTEALISTSGTRLICEASENARPLSETVPAKGPVTVFIGPEGGFRVDEVRSAMDAGLVQVALGPVRLRAETAAVFALSRLS